VPSEAAGEAKAKQKVEKSGHRINKINKVNKADRDEIPVTFPRI
jgi:hypothetical protein